MKLILTVEEVENLVNGSIATAREMQDFMALVGQEDIREMTDGCIREELCTSLKESVDMVGGSLVLNEDGTYTLDIAQEVLSKGFRKIPKILKIVIPVFTKAYNYGKRHHAVIMKMANMLKEEAKKMIEKECSEEMVIEAVAIQAGLEQSEEAIKSLLNIKKVEAK